MSMFVCVSIREDISGTTCVVFTNFLCMLPMAVARSFFGRVTKSKAEGAIWGFSSPLTMHCNAFAAKEIILISGCTSRAMCDI